jgi:hypothetical protein
MYLKLAKVFRCTIPPPFSVNVPSISIAKALIVSKSLFLKFGG